MTDKEKALAYDKALERAKEELGSGSFDRGSIEYIFPELKESEDEEMRKALTEGLVDISGDQGWSDFGGVPIDDILAWLEKQGEKSYEELPQTPHKYNVGNWIISKYNSIYQVKEVLKGSYNLLSTNNAEEINSISQVDNSSRLLCMKDIQNLLEKQGEQKPLIDFKAVDWNVSEVDGETHKITSSDKVEQKSAEWSKDDEHKLNGICSYLNCSDSPEGYTKWIDWLKSLRPQSHWKPSDEQIEAFEHFVRSLGESGYASPYEDNTKLIYSLIQDLKKLKD